METKAQFQSNDRLSNYGDSYYKDKTVDRLVFSYGNPYNSKTTFYIDGPQYMNELQDRFVCLSIFDREYVMHKILETYLQI